MDERQHVRAQRAVQGLGRQRDEPRAEQHQRADRAVQIPQECGGAAAAGALWLVVVAMSSPLSPLRGGCALAGQRHHQRGHQGVGIETRIARQIAQGTPVVERGREVEPRQHLS